MVYKRYVKGKPYLYHNYRENGKVRSVYIGRYKTFWEKLKDFILGK